MLTRNSGVTPYTGAGMQASVIWKWRGMSRTSDVRVHVLTGSPEDTRTTSNRLLTPQSQLKISQAPG